MKLEATMTRGEASTCIIIMLLCMAFAITYTLVSDDDSREGIAKQLAQLGYLEDTK